MMSNLFLTEVVTVILGIMLGMLGLLKPRKKKNEQKQINHYHYH